MLVSSDFLCLSSSAQDSLFLSPEVSNPVQYNVLALLWIFEVMTALLEYLITNGYITDFIIKF